MSIPLRGCPHSRTDSPQNARNAAGIHQHAHSKETPYNAPQNAAQRTPKPQHQQHPKPNHSTEPGRLFKITFYSNPGEVAPPQGSPNGDPQTAPQRAGTPPGCNGVAPQTEAAHSGAQAAQRATENAPSRSPERCALFIHFQQVGENHQRKNQNAK